MNEANSIINKFLLAGDKFMPELHLIDSIDLDKTCFQHDMAYNKYKDSERRTQSDIVLKNKAFKIASNRRCNGYERGVASMVYKFFDKSLKDLV